MKKDKKKDDKKSEISLEDLIEKERAALGVHQTKITLETFIAWKKRKIQEKKDAATREEEKKRNDYKAGRQIGLSGREMFSFNPELAADYDMEDGDEAFDSYAIEEEEETENNIQYRELDLNILEFEAQEVDGTGTVAPEDRLKENEVNASKESTPELIQDAVPINENLFVDDDLDDIDDELNDLDLDQ